MVYIYTERKKEIEFIKYNAPSAMHKRYLLILALSFLVHHSLGFQGSLTVNNLVKDRAKNEGREFNFPLLKFRDQQVVAAEVINDTPHSSPSSKSRIASIFGYVIGAGSLSLYLPILLDMVRRGNAEGMAIQTWISSFSSMTLALVYPLKKGFALSTYIEILALQCQSLVILGTICFYKGLLKEFALGTAMVALLLTSLLRAELPKNILSSIQITRVCLDTFTLIPQILLNFSTRSFRYSEITACLSFTGNAMRIFTTLQLVKDPLVLIGYIMGLTNNIVLLLQFYFFGKS